MLTDEICPNCDSQMRLEEPNKFVCDVCGFYFYDDDLAEEYLNRMEY